LIKLKLKIMSKESVLITALEKIIEMNRQNAEDQYGNADKAERWSCVTVAREAIKKYNTETKEPFIKEEPKDHIPDVGKMIGEDELKEKFKKHSHGYHPNNATYDGGDYHASECVKIAQQYANSKLEELEKWIDETIKEQQYHIAISAFNDVKDEIKTLKQKI